jgi:rSAM/selenodomain-associated transferase 1
MRPGGTVVVMARAPRLGTVKRRLAAEIGAHEALAVYRRLLARTLAVTRGGPWRALLAGAPPDWPAPSPSGLGLVAQVQGDLGRRMAAAAHVAPARPVLLIGSDIAGLATRHLHEGFRALARAELVFGPACDGGFWAVGARRPERLAALFAGIPWSRPDTLAQVVARCPATPAMIATLTDVDTAADLAAVRRNFPGLI